MKLKKKLKGIGRGKKIGLVIIGILLIIGVAVGLGSYYTNNMLSKINKVNINEENIGISPKWQNQSEDKDKIHENSIISNESQQSEKIRNIVLFGIDATDGNHGRSDAIVIVTIDKNNNKLKLTSIMRDSYVNIPGRKMDKINHAYAFGGPELALKTLNKNFELNLKDFISVNFSSLPKIIDSIGGIDLDIDSEELKAINQHIRHNNEINGTNSSYINKTGVQSLDGTQAMAYCRIRYTLGGDYERTGRHREVLTKIFDKISSMPVVRYPFLLNELLPMVTTNLDTEEILALGSNLVSIDNLSLEQERFPRDEYCEGKIINRIYYLTFNKDETVKQIHNYIYNDIKN